MQAKDSIEFSYDSIMDAIIEVESEGNPAARNGSCVGILQISPCLVKECNRILRKKKEKRRYTLSDRRSIKKSKEMFIIFNEYYNPQHDIEKMIRAWKGGINYSKRKTERYYKKVMQILKN